MSEYRVINSRPPRLDAPAKATGRAVYIDDMSFPNMLYGAMLQSPLAHARILNIDTSRAEAPARRQGRGHRQRCRPGAYGVSPARYDETLFCHDKVRYVGDEIAAVAAVDMETAVEAVGLIKVDYEELPAVLTIEEAMAEGAPQLHDEFPAQHLRRGASGVRRRGGGLEDVRSHQNHHLQEQTPGRRLPRAPRLHRRFRPGTAA